jgi:hypothetical protein
MDNFLTWVGRNRIPIGCSIGALNFFTAGHDLAIGEVWNALMFLIFGIVITIDVLDSK